MEDLMRTFISEVRDGVVTLANTIQTNAALKSVKPLVKSDPEEFKIWAEGVEKYFTITGIDDKGKSRIVLLTTGGPVGCYAHELIKCDPEITWAKLKVEIGEFCNEWNNPRNKLLELVNIKQGESESIREYLLRARILSKEAYGADSLGKEVVQAQIKEFLIDGIRDKNLRLAIIRAAPKDPGEVSQLAINENNYRRRAKASQERGAEHTEVCLARERRNCRIPSTNKTVENHYDNRQICIVDQKSDEHRADRHRQPVRQTQITREKKDYFTKGQQRANPRSFRRSCINKPCNQTENVPTYTINRIASPNSISVKIGHKKYKALVDTGAEVSIISSRVYEALRPKPSLSKNKMKLQTANGSPLRMEGLVGLEIKIGSQSIFQNCCVVRNLNRKIILGRDWLRSHGVRMYFDLGVLRLNGEYVEMEEDIHISSIVTVAEDVTLKPQHLHTCVAKVKGKAEVGTVYEVEQIKTGTVSKLCGISVANSIIKINKERKIIMGIMNNTNQTVTLKRGWPIGKLIEAGKINEVSLPTLDRLGAEDKELENIKCAKEFQSEVVQLLRRNRDRFTSDDKHLGKTDTVKMHINTGNHPPIKKRPYPTPLAQKRKVEEAIDQMMEARVVERSRSPWGFPIVLVEKKDGSSRFCVDFRDLNKITRRNSFPLPVISHILASLGRAKYFSKLDLKSGYWQVEMDESDKEKTAFTCHYGLFHFNVMPFGLANAPGIFQELMSIVLQGQEKYALAYLDDVLVFSETRDEHLKHLQRVFDSLRKHNLKLKPSKCEFFNEETQYLGFKISRKGIQPDQDKVTAIQSVIAPKTVRQVRGFIGMCSYYRRFIPNFARIAEPLINLTRKYARFKWDENCQNAFDKLKKRLSEMVVLAYPDPNKRYKLYTDASDHTIGACLTQEVYDEDIGEEVEKPIHFLSHKLSDTQTRWTTIEKEAYAIHYTLQKFHHYLYSASFTIYTDHRPLEYLLKSPMQNRKIQVWALAIAGYDCEIEYLPGKENVVADLLSRSTTAPAVEDVGPVEVDDRAYGINAINSNRLNPGEFASYKDNQEENRPEFKRPTMEGFNIIAEQESDEEIVSLKKRVNNEKASKLEQKKFIILEGVLYYLSQPEEEPILRLYVPSHLRHEVMLQYHDKNGHLGIEKTFQAIRQKYFWPCLFREVVGYVNKCVSCQTMNLRKIPPRMQESDMPPYPFAKIALDITGPYPKTHSGNEYIVTFIDMYSGWPEAFAVPNKKAETVAHLLMEEIFPRFGAPLQLVTDNGPENVNKIMKRTLENLNIHHVTTSFYHPQSNGKVERLHRTMNSILAKKIGDNDRSWDLYINQMLAAIRFNVSETTKFSPFYLLYSRDVVLPLDNILKPRRLHYGDQHHEMAIQEQHRAFVRVRSNMLKAKKTNIEKSEKRTKDVVYKVGDLVYYKNFHKKNRLGQKWLPFYVIIERTGPVSYRIRDQLTSSVTKAHAEQLRAANIDRWELPKVNRPLRKVIMAASLSSEESDHNANVEGSESGGNEPCGLDENRETSFIPGRFDHNINVEQSETARNETDWLDGNVETPVVHEESQSNLEMGDTRDFTRRWTDPYQRDESDEDETIFICRSPNKNAMSTEDNCPMEVNIRKPKRYRSDSESDDLVTKRSRHLREESEDELDIPVMERKIAIENQDREDSSGCSGMDETSSYDEEENGDDEEDPFAELDKWESRLINSIKKNRGKEKPSRIRNKRRLSKGKKEEVESYDSLREKRKKYIEALFNIIKKKHN